MWVAKNKLNGKEYGRVFESIYDCQSYIDKELHILNYLYAEIRYKEDFLDGKIKFYMSNVILCYNVEQNRFCTGFDF